MPRIPLRFDEGKLTLQARLFGPFIKNPKDIGLLLDTGASNTILSLKDTEELEIDVPRLQVSRRPTAGYGGRTELLEVPEVLIVLLQENEELVSIPMEKVFVNHARGIDKKKASMVYAISSILGVDVLIKGGLAIHADWARKEAFATMGT